MSFIEAEVDGQDGVDGLFWAVSLAMSPDGRHVYVAAAGDNAISVFRRDAASGALEFVEAEFDGAAGVDGLLGAHFVEVSRDGSHVYASGGAEDAIAVFERNRATGELSFVEAVFDGVDGVDGLDGIVGLALSPDGYYLYAASYRDRAVAVFQRDAATGSLTFVEAEFDGVGGVDGLAGANAVTVGPDGTHLYAVSLDRNNDGSREDALAVFSRNLFTGALDFVEVHFDFDGVDGVAGLRGASAVLVEPEGSHVYVAGFYDRAVVAFARDPASGALDFEEAQFDGVGGVDGLLNVRHVAMSPDGAHLYAAALSNPAKISVFAVNRSGLCGDGIDNDGDGLIDFIGGDPGCDDEQDGSERSAALICDNGLDDDGDGWVDFVADLDGDGIGEFPGDPGCWDAEQHRKVPCPGWDRQRPRRGHRFRRRRIDERRHSTRGAGSGMKGKRPHPGESELRHRLRAGIATGPGAGAADLDAGRRVRRPPMLG